MDHIGTFKTGNTTWRVHVENKQFAAYADGFSKATGDTWKAMENSAKVQASKAKIKVSIPYVQLDRDRLTTYVVLVRRTATGLHAGSGNILYTDESGKPGQESSWRLGDILKPLSAEDESEYLGLIARRSELNRRITAIEDSYRFEGGLKSEIERAVSAEHARRQAQMEGGSDA